MLGAIDASRARGEAGKEGSAGAWSASAGVSASAGGRAAAAVRTSIIFCMKTLAGYRVCGSCEEAPVRRRAFGQGVGVQPRRGYEPHLRRARAREKMVQLEASAIVLRTR